MSQPKTHADTSKSMFSAAPAGNYPRISDKQSNLSNGNNRAWYLDVDYVEEVAIEKAFAGADKAA